MKKKDEYNVSSTFSDAHIADIIAQKKNGKTWEQIQKNLNKKYKVEKGRDAYRNVVKCYGHLFEIEDQDLYIQKLQEISRTRRASSKNAKENRKIVDSLNDREDILEAITEVVKDLGKQKITLPKRKVKKGLKGMTKELLLSDIHFGKETKTFNLAICRRRLQELTQTLLDDIARDSKSYNVERLIVAMLGDIIESEMHGIESFRGLEFGTARQMAEAINSLFLDVMKPLAKLGIKIDVPAVCGNHDRIDPKRTMTDPGLNNVSWTIYKTLELLCAQAGFKNVTFHIPVGPYVVLDIYGTKVLFEHGDSPTFKGTGRTKFETAISKRSSQLGVLIDCVRSGHLHEFCVFGRGRSIQNASVVGQDSFSDVLGYASEAGQAISSYVITKRRPTSFFKTFLVDLEQVT